MTVFDSLLGLLGASGVLVGVASVVAILARVGPAERPVFGARGVKRTRALATSVSFAFAEPLLLYGAGFASRLPARALRSRFSKLLTHSGEYLGLSEDELVAACLLGSAVVGALGVVATLWAGSSPLWIGVAALGGAYAPVAKVFAVARERVAQVTRSLPSVIELIAMCMSAGLDLPASLRRVASSAASERDPIVEELQRMLTELDLGNTRRSVMLRFASRVPSPDVRELVNSVVQSEDKGTPLSHILQIQSKTLRLRRSATAEQAASRAALMLVGPTSLIFLCVLVLLLGPVIIRFVSGGGMPA